eukprot:TRINITY_DN5994_c0_g1_i1.p1 TRINITY_DN5994_c0_g1~~TRINITY_DN5994_c0_g1_i1.p1  ORF type:complete len:256 (-),score=43.95 TRINITY_DN5994_c0_g1_i1:56-823(-)
MAANFWQSTHCTAWIKKREEIHTHNRDREILGDERLQNLRRYCVKFIQDIGKRFRFRQRVIASAIVYLKRFYLRFNFVECDPELVAPTCLYIATKVEEASITAKSLAQWMQGIVNPSTGWKYKDSHVLVMELYIMEALNFQLVVFHPYRPLLQFAHDAGLDNDTLDAAWRVCNDSYRSDVCLLYPPHIIALACIHIGAVTYERDAHQWLRELCVDPREIAACAQDILEVYRTGAVDDEQAKLAGATLAQHRHVVL